MAAIHPFRALRPTPDRAAAVAAVPYDVVNAAEARELADGNPLSFLRVSRAEIELPADTPPYADVVYATAVAQFRSAPRARRRWSSRRRRASTCTGCAWATHEQTGWRAASRSTSTSATSSGSTNVRGRTRKTTARGTCSNLRAQTGPVFLTYPASSAVDADRSARGRGPRRSSTSRRRMACSTRSGVWRRPRRGRWSRRSARFPCSTSPTAITAPRARCARAQELRARRAAQPHLSRPTRSWPSRFPSDQAQILPYHRVVKDLAGHTPASLLEALRARLTVRPGGRHAGGAGEVAMYLDGAWHALTLAPARPRPRRPIDSTSRSCTTRCWRPLLQIGDIRDGQADRFRRRNPRPACARRGSSTTGRRRSRSRCTRWASPT